MPKGTQSKTISRIFNSKLLKNFTKNSLNSQNRVSLVLKNRKKVRLATIFATIVLVILIPIIALTLRKGEQVAAWFDESYQYRKPVTVTVTSAASDVSNLETLLTIDTSTLISASKMQSDCDDMRFTSTTGKLLPYYLSSGCNTSTTKVWVMADMVPKNTTTYDLFFYYGQPNVSSGSDSNTMYKVAGLVGYWNMNENTGTSTNDSSGNTNTGTLGVGSSAPSWSGSGKYGSALSFDGTNDQVRVPNSSSLGVTTNITISTWIKRTNTNRYESFVAKSNLTSRWDYQFYIVNVTNTLRFYSDATSPTTVSSTGTITDTNWHHVAITRSGSAVSFFIDGVLDSTVTMSGSFNNNADPVYFGNDGFTGWYQGLMDDTRIYNRALSSSEVAQLYTDTGATLSSANTTINPSTSFGTEQASKGPLGYWKFDEGVGTTATDTMKRNNGTLGVGSSAPLWKPESECKFGKCLFFDGTNDEVNYGDINQIDGATALTMSAWVKFNSLTSYAPILAKITSGQSGSYLALGGSGSDTSSALCAAVRTGSNNTQDGCTANGTMEINKWYFVTYRYDGAGSGNSGKLKIYIDGNEKSLTYRGTIPTSMASTSQSLYTGSYGPGFAIYLNGYVDEPKVYPYARSAAEIKQDFVGGPTTQGSSATTANIQQQGNLSNGLIAQWKMDDGTGTSASDSSGNGKTATLGAGSSAPSWATGKFGSGLTFDGSNDYASVADSGSADPLRMTSATEYTLAGWVNITDLSASNQHFIVSKYDFSGQQGYSLLVNSTGSIRFDVNGNVNAKTTTATPITAGSWYHIAGVFSGGNKMQVFVNGALLETFNITSTSLTAYTGSLGIGSPSNNLGNDSFTTYGKLDDVRIYNRGLAPSEISQLYNFAPGPVAYYKLDETSGTSAQDSSNNSNTGTLGVGNSAPTWSIGKYGGSATFDGSNDYISVADSTSLDTTKDAFTLEAWVYDTDVDDGSNDARVILGKGDSSSGQSNTYRLRIHDGKEIRLQLGDGSTAQNIITTTKTVPYATWTHVAATYDGTNARVYINGVLEGGPTARSVGTLVDAGNLVLGRQSALDCSSGNNCFNGKLDDIKIYNYARTASQIVGDFNADHPNVGTPVGSTVLNLKFDEGYGSTTYDKSPQANNGTLGTGSSAPSWTNSGKFGKALDFDGSNDYVSMADSSSMDFNDQDFSISGWFNRDTSNTDDIIIAKRNGTAAGNQGWMVWIDDTADKITFEISDATDEYSLVSSTAFTSTGWNYFTVVWDDDDATNSEIYVNGKDDNATDTGTIANIGDLSNGNTTRISDVSDSGSTLNSHHFDGKLDDIKVYPFALTPDEIKLDYNQGKLNTMGAISTASDGITASNGTDRSYCVPGDTSTCNAPVAEWKFDEGTGTSANDTSGNSNTGTLGTGSSAPQWSAGKYGNALTFDGTNDYVTAGDLNILDGVTTFTISTWVKLNAITGDAGIFSKRNSDNDRILLAVANSGYGGTDDVIVGLANGSNTYGNTNSNFLVTGQWMHFTVVYNGAGSANADKLKLYRNGVQETLSYGGTIPTTTDSNSDSFDIGRENQGGARYINGIIDDMRIYDYVRAPAQVAWEFSRGAPVLNYRFDECQGTTINDWAPNANGGYVGNNATLTIGGTGTQTSIGTCSSSGAWFAGASGKINSSISLDATDDYLEVSDPSSGILDFADGENFTISVWVKPTSVSSNQVVFAKKNGTANTLIGYLGYINNQGKVVFVAATDSSNNISLFSNSLVTAGTWTHLTYAYNGASNTVKVYINGKDAGGTPTVTGDPATLANSLAFEVGAESDDQVFFGGQIDDLKLYRYLLTQDQIQTDMAGGAVSFR